MVRRAASGWVLSLALFAASVAWTGFTLQRTTLDASRTAKVADTLLTDSKVRDAIVSSIVGLVDKGLPVEVRPQVSTDLLVNAARSALAAPGPRADLERALVDTHRYLLGDLKTAPVLDSSQIDLAVRQNLVQARPELAGVVAAIPKVEIPLPAVGLPAVRGLRSVVDLVTWWAAVLAGAVAIGALAVSPDRGWVLRRIGRWALGAGLLWVALRFAVPAVGRRFAPSSSALLSSLATAVSERMAGPGTVLAALGGACMGLGSLLGLRRRRARLAVVAATPATRYEELRRIGAPLPEPHRPNREQRKAARTASTAQIPAAAAVPTSSPTAGAPPGVALVAPNPLQAVPSMRRPATMPPAAVPYAGAAPRAHRVAPVSPSAGQGLPGLPPLPGLAPDMAAYRAPAQPPAKEPAPVAPGAPSNGRADAPKEPTPSFTPRKAAPEDGDDSDDPNFPGGWLGGFSLDPAAHPRLADPAPAPPRWVEGVGYVFDYPPMEGVRWIEGLGYVVPEEDIGFLRYPETP